MAAAHSPGPWHRNIPPATRYPVIFAGRNQHVARVVVDGLSPAEVDANCDLITAAPALLAALKVAREHLYCFTETDKTLAIVDAAIAAATGERG